MKSLRCLKKLITYLNLRAFSTFHTCSLTALAPKLTEVAWRTRKSWSSGAEDRWIFSGAHRGLRSFIMAHREKSLKEKSRGRRLLKVSQPKVLTKLEHCFHVDFTFTLLTCWWLDYSFSDHSKLPFSSARAKTKI